MALIQNSLISLVFGHGDGALASNLFINCWIVEARGQQQRHTDGQRLEAFHRTILHQRQVNV